MTMTPPIPGKYPDGNPKTPFGIKKPPLWYVPFPALMMTALAHLQGALKYGHYNWRTDPVSASTYINAAMRHIAEWTEGGETAEDSGIHHLAHAVACLNIVMDAQRYGTLIDDRNPLGADMGKLFKDLEPLVKRIYADWGPPSPYASTSPNVPAAFSAVAISDSSSKENSQ